MIALDTSALITVVKKEPGYEAAHRILLAADVLVISAATLAEVHIVSRRRGYEAAMAPLLGGLDLEVAAVNGEIALRAADAYDRWGRGVHPAGLNIMDCFAYALAMERRCPLLFVGEDFAKTDVRPALTVSR